MLNIHNEKKKTELLREWHIISRKLNALDSMLLAYGGTIPCYGINIWYFYPRCKIQK